MMMDNGVRSHPGIRSETLCVPSGNFRASKIGLFRTSHGPQAPFMGRRFLAGVRKSAAVYHPVDHYIIWKNSFPSRSLRLGGKH